MLDPLATIPSTLAHQSSPSQSTTTESSSQQQNPPSSSNSATTSISRRPRLQSSGTSGSTITQDSISIPLSPRQFDSSTHDQGEGLKRKRPRVSKACTYCRKKKVKCDGNLPCSNCKDNNEGECIYVADPEKKPKPPKPPKAPKVPKPKPEKPEKKTKAQTIDQVNLRLDRIEDLLGSLTEEIRGARKLTSDELQPTIADEETANLKDDGPEPRCIETNESSSYPEIKNNKFGSHGIIDIFSKSSLESLFRGLGPNNRTEVKDILLVGSIYNYYSHAFMDSICQPIKSVIRNRTDLMDNTFTDSSVPLELLNYLDDIYIVSYICEPSYIKSLFESYFKNNKKCYTKGLGPKLRSFTWSEFMIMSVLVALCISDVVDERNVTTMKKTSKHSSPLLQSMTNKQLVELDTKCFFSAVFYYNRLVLSCEGIETVQALALFVIYLQTVMSSIKLTHIPIAIATRYAQDLGFHRPETYEGLSWHERFMRKRLWWFCQTFEVAYCYRYGKPVQVREDGLTSLIDGDKSTLIMVQSSIDRMRALWEDAKILKNVSNLYELAENKTLHRSAAYFLYQLTKIRLQSFDWIYSISSQNMKLIKIFAYIDQINKQMRDLAKLFQPPITICYYNDPRFFFTTLNKPLDQVLAFDSGLNNFLSMYMNYYQHLMTINRVAIQEIPPGGTDEALAEKVSEYRHISLESARTILHIVKSFNLQTMSYTAFSWYLYEPFAAFCHLASVHFANPNSSEAETDLKLMIEVSLDFFSFKNSTRDVKIQRNCIRQKLYDLTTRYLLRIFMNITNKGLKTKLFSKNKALQTHLDLPQQFPEFYTPEGQLGMNQVSTSKVFEMWFRAYNFTDTESSADTTGVNRKPATSNNDKSGTATGNSESSGSGSGKSISSMSKGNTSTSASSEISNPIPEKGNKSPTNRKMDGILKRAVSPLSSTKVRLGFAEDYRENEAGYSQPQYSSHSIPFQQLHQSSQSAKEKLRENHSQHLQTLEMPQQQYNSRQLTQLLYDPFSQLSHLFHPQAMFQGQPHQQRPLSLLQPQPYLAQLDPLLMPPPLNFMPNYAPRYLDTSSTASHQYLPNAVPQAHQIELQQNASGQQQQHTSSMLSPQTAQLPGIVPSFQESFDPGNIMSIDNQQSEIWPQFGNEFVDGANMNEQRDPPGE